MWHQNYKIDQQRQRGMEESFTLGLMLTSSTDLQFGRNLIFVKTLTTLIPVDGQWGAWGSWQSCSKSCGGGTQTRWRHCDNPAPAQGGLHCSDESSQERQCNTQACYGKDIIGLIQTRFFLSDPPELDFRPCRINCYNQPRKAVSCGGHTASRCAECPMGHGALWCNGECTWKYGGCHPK